MAGRLERRWKGDRFRILDPAHLPEKPDSPKPLRILGLGFMLGLLVGLASVARGRAARPDRQGRRAAADDLLPYPVLARIPHLPSLGSRPAVR